MGQATIEVQYRVQRSGKDKIKLRITADDAGFEKIRLNAVMNSLGTHHMQGYALIVDCDEEYDNHLAFETIISQICAGIQYNYTFVDLGIEGKPAIVTLEYPIKLTPTNGVTISLYEKSVIYKSTAEHTPTVEAFKISVKDFIKFMKSYDYKIQDEYTITFIEDKGVKYLRALLKISSKGKEEKFITDLQKK